MNILSLLVLPLFFVKAACVPFDKNAGEIECPEGSLNSGWTVVESYAFRDPIMCCGPRVSKWEVSQYFSIKDTETGCLMAKMLVDRRVQRHIYPLLCSSTEDCGDISSDGRKMECCPERYCLAKSRNGTTKCHDDREELLSYQLDPTESIKKQCQLQKLNTCISCYNICPATHTVLSAKRKKRQVKGPVVTDIIHLTNPNPGANSESTPIQGDPSVTTLPIPQIPSAPPFQLLPRASSVKQGVSVNLPQVPNVMAQNEGEGPGKPTVDVDLTGQPQTQESVSDSGDVDTGVTGSSHNSGDGPESSTIKVPVGGLPSIAIGK